MSGLFFRVYLLLSIVFFLLQLTVVVVIKPFRSFIFAVLLSAWIGGSALSLLSNPSAQTMQQEVESPLFSLLLQDISNAGFKPTEITPSDLERKLQSWEKEVINFPNTRDILLNGALLHFSLGDTTKAQALYSKAKATDPNNPLFKLQINQFFK